MPALLLLCSCFWTEMSAVDIDVPLVVLALRMTYWDAPTVIAVYTFTSQARFRGQMLCCLLSITILFCVNYFQ